MEEPRNRSPWALPKDAPICDIVMKGGITSGVVYPTAVCELAKSYRLKSVGGTSAGAIAAVAAAAAELGRDATSGKNFELLQQLPITLGEDLGRTTRLESVFNSDPQTRRFFRILRAGVIKKNPSWAYVLTLANFPFHVVIGLALVAAAATLASVSTLSWLGATCVFFLAALLIAVGSPVDFVRGIVRKLPENGFGLTTLGPECDRGEKPALTQWLHDRIQELANRKPDQRPVTFGDLWLREAPAIEWGEPDLRDYRPTVPPQGKREISLEMMTTDLTHGRAMRLPVPSAAAGHTSEAPTLLVSLKDVERYFPAEVVKHFEERAEMPSPQILRAAEGHAPDDLRVFPTGPQLPIVVAARMSLSFPLLISAFPLWQAARVGEGLDLRQVWFSDGGMTSNFPIHFFDRPLPRWPTFAFTFGSAPEESDGAPAPGAGATPDPPKRLGTLASFLVAVKDATQNWRDNAQAALPGFQERIAAVPLSTGEGGLNLAMDAKQIEDLGRRGAEAAQGLTERFPADAPPEVDTPWNRHRFGRYRTALALIEQLTLQFRLGYDWPATGGTMSYTALQDAVRPDADPYRFPSEDVSGAAAALSLALIERATLLEGISVFDVNVPYPRPELRIVPTA